MTPALPESRAELPPGTPLFALRGVCLARHGVPILNDVSLDLPRGSITGLVGPSGAGKTSLIRLLNRLDEPASGSIEYLGRPLAQYAVRALRRRIAFVFQTAALFPGSVADNLQAAWAVGPDAGHEPDMAAVLDAVGLGASFARRPAAELSGGEQQRVALGRALMTSPEVLLLDEPTSALDPEATRRLLATLTTLAHERGVSIVLVTHRLAEARQATSFMVMLEAGRVVEAGATATLFASAQTERARAYLASEA